MPALVPGVGLKSSTDTFTRSMLGPCTVLTVPVEGVETATPSARVKSTSRIASTALRSPSTPAAMLVRLTVGTVIGLGRVVLDVCVAAAVDVVEDDVVVVEVV